MSIWAAFLVGTRFAITKNFSVEEILVLRLLPAANNDTIYVASWHPAPGNN